MSVQTSCPNPKINSRNSPVEPWFMNAEWLTSPILTGHDRAWPRFIRSVARNLVFLQHGRLRLRCRCHHHRAMFFLLFYFEIGKCYFVWRISVVSLYSIVFHSECELNSNKSHLVLLLWLFADENEEELLLEWSKSNCSNGCSAFSAFVVCVEICSRSGTH